MPLYSWRSNITEGIKITKHYEVTKRYHRGEEVTIDTITLRAWFSGRSETVDHLIDGEWIPYKPPQGRNGHLYSNYKLVVNPARIADYFRGSGEPYDGLRLLVHKYTSKPGAIIDDSTVSG